MAATMATTVAEYTMTTTVATKLVKCGCVHDEEDEIVVQSNGEESGGGNNGGNDGGGSNNGGNVSQSARKLC